MSGKLPIDFYISHKGRQGEIVREVLEILRANAYTAIYQDHDIGLGANFTAAFDQAVNTSRHLVVLLTKEFMSSPFNQREVTNFLAAHFRDPARRVIVLRVKDCEAAGI